MNRRSLLALSVATPALLAAAPVLAQLNTLPPTTTVTFSPGSNTASLKNQIAPGANAVYTVQAKAGQTLMLSVAPTPESAPVTLQVFKASAGLEKGANGMALVTGTTLPGASAADNVRAWIGAIPQDGNYLILISMAPAATAAPTPYTLIVTLQ
jgi:hypothetical protein